MANDYSTIDAIRRVLMRATPFGAASASWDAIKQLPGAIDRGMGKVAEYGGTGPLDPGFEMPEGYQPGLASPLTLAPIAEAVFPGASGERVDKNRAKLISGLYHGIKSAATAPMRAATGELPMTEWDPATGRERVSDAAIEEANNFALNVMGGASVVPTKAAIGAGAEPVTGMFTGRNARYKPSAEDRIKLGDDNYWAAVVDKQDGHVYDKVPYERAQEGDFHHTFYLGDKARNAVDEGNAVMVWDNGEGLDWDRGAFAGGRRADSLTPSEAEIVRAAVGRDKSNSLFSNAPNNPLAELLWYHGSGTGPVDLSKWRDQPMYFANERPMAEGYAKERGWDGPESQYVHEAKLDTSKFMDAEEYRALLEQKFNGDEWLNSHPSEAATVADPMMMQALKERGKTGVQGLWDFWMDDHMKESPVAAVIDPNAIEFLSANKGDAGSLLLTALMDRNGKVFKGKPGQIHAEVMDDYHSSFTPDELAQMDEFGEVADTVTPGFVTLEGKFLDRSAAYNWVQKNEPGPAERLKTDDGMGQELEAYSYQDLDGLFANKGKGTEALAGVLAARGKVQELEALPEFQSFADRPGLQQSLRKVIQLRAGGHGARADQIEKAMYDQTRMSDWKHGTERAQSLRSTMAEIKARLFPQGYKAPTFKDQLKASVESDASKLTYDEFLTFTHIDELRRAGKWNDVKRVTQKWLKGPGTPEQLKRRQAAIQELNDAGDGWSNHEGVGNVWWGKPTGKRPKGSSEVFANKAKGAGLVVALRDANGRVHVGEPGQIHVEAWEASGFDPSWQTALEDGFATPDGKFLTRQEALRWVEENEPLVRQEMTKGTEEKWMQENGLLAEEYDTRSKTKKGTLYSNKSDAAPGAVVSFDAARTRLRPGDTSWITQEHPGVEVLKRDPEVVQLAKEMKDEAAAQGINNTDLAWLSTAKSRLNARAEGHLGKHEIEKMAREVGVDPGKAADAYFNQYIDQMDPLAAGEPARSPAAFKFWLAMQKQKGFLKPDTPERIAGRKFMRNFYGLPERD